MSPSKIIEFTNRTRDMLDRGIPVINMTIGEPDFDTPDNIKKARIAAVEAGKTKYTTPAGLPELKKIICEKLLADDHVVYTADEICVSAGARQSVFEAIFATCDENCEVIIPTPAWVSYEEMVKLSGADPVLVPMDREDGYELDVEKIAAAVTPRTRMVILNNPNNPTGRVYAEKSLRALAELAVEKDFYILSDEIYEKMIYDGNRHFCLPSVSEEVKEHCILINGFSKSHAMTGWRVGYAAGPKEVIAAMAGIQSHLTSSVNEMAQYAAEEAYSGSQEAVLKMTDEYRMRRDAAIAGINRLPYLKARCPQGTYYILIDVSGLIGKRYADGETMKNSMDIALSILENAHVALLPGDAFHAEGNLRMCFASEIPVIEEAMERIGRYLEKIR